MAEGPSVNSYFPSYGLGVKFTSELFCMMGFYTQSPFCDPITCDTTSFFEHMIDEHTPKTPLKVRGKKRDVSYTDRSQYALDDISPHLRDCAYVDEKSNVIVDFKKYSVKKYGQEKEVYPNRPIPGEVSQGGLIEKLYAKHFKTFMEYEDSDETTVEQQESERMTECGYEKENKLCYRKSRLKKTYKRMFKPESKMKEDVGTSCQILADNLMRDEDLGLNLLRLVAFPSLCEKLCSPQFVDGAFADDEDDIDIIEETFEFKSEILEYNILELVNREDFFSVASNLKNNPRVNAMLPLFMEFLSRDTDCRYRFECLTIMLAFLQNPYLNIQFNFDIESTYGSVQWVIAEFLINSFQRTCMFKNVPNYLNVCKECIIRFAELHKSHLVFIVAGLDELLNIHEGELAYDIYCKILDVVTTIGGMMIETYLPQHFEKMYTLAVSDLCDDANDTLYYLLLKAAEFTFENIIENYSFVEELSSENDLVIFYATCYKRFSKELSPRLSGDYEMIEGKKSKFEKFLASKHLIFNTKYGYLDLKTEMLCEDYKRKMSLACEVSETSQISEESPDYVTPINSAVQVYFNFSTTQFGFVGDDMDGLSNINTEYFAIVEEFPLFYYEDIVDFLKPKSTKNLSLMSINA